MWAVRLAVTQARTNVGDRTIRPTWSLMKPWRLDARGPESAFSVVATAGSPCAARAFAAWDATSFTSIAFMTSWLTRLMMADCTAGLLASGVMDDT